MQIFTPMKWRVGKLSQISAFTILLLILSFNTIAQRSYSLVYSENLKGTTILFGNTLLRIQKTTGMKPIDTLKMNDNRKTGNSIYGNDKENMVNIDIDGTTGPGAGTRNSSSSDLILPVGNSIIKFARLYWGGRIKNNEIDFNIEANRIIKIRKGNSNAYTNVNALSIDESEIIEGFTQYQAYADVTAFITQNGGGTYTVGNVPLATGAVSNGGNHGGWAIVVVYENNSSPYSSVRVYDGFQKVYSGGATHTSSVTLTGLNVPSGAMAAGDAKMGVMAWEGDANLGGDFLKINGTLLGNAVNPLNNPWNGTISNNGEHVTTKNPNYTNNMGLDIDQFEVGNGFGINPNDNTVNLVFGTESDQYYPGLFTFSILMKNPSLTLSTTVRDANNNGQAEPGEVLTYTLKGKNVGIGNANDVVLIDTLPSTVTYVPNSLKVMQSPEITARINSDPGGDDIAEYISNGAIKTINFRLGRGANARNGGILGEGQTYEVQFAVTVNIPAKGQIIPSIMNIARIYSTSDAAVAFVNDATAILNPEAGPLPVSLMSFTANLLSGNKVQVDWATATEINNSHFIVERSIDGKYFSPVVKVNGNGTSSIVHNYSITDDVSNAGSIVYFRLQQIDIDAKSTYSNVVALRLKKDNQIASVSPNPFTSYLNINMEWSKSEVITARIINIQGKEVVTKKLQVTKGVNNVRIDELSNLSSGSYFIQFISATERITQKISK